MAQNAEDKETLQYWEELESLKKQRRIENFIIIHGHHPSVPCSIRCTPEE